MKIQLNADVLHYDDTKNYNESYFFVNETFFAPFISSIDNKVYLLRDRDSLYSLPRQEFIDFNVDTIIREFEIPEDADKTRIGQDKFELYKGYPNIPVYLPYVIYKDQFRNPVKVFLPNVEKAQLFIDTVKQICEDYWINTQNLTAKV